MELKSGYKQTEVGVIPEDWEVSNIGQACRIVTTGKLDANAMVESGEYKFFTCAREVYQIDNYAFDCEALLISGNGAHVGYIHYYEGRFNAYQRTYVLTDFSAHIKFVQCVLENSFRDRIQTEVRAGGTPYITRSTITESPIPLPPTKAEQEAIAEALSDADALIASLEQLIAKKRLIKQGAMQELLTGKHRLPGFSGDWEEKTLGDVVETDPENLGANTPADYRFNYVSLEDVQLGYLASFTEQDFATAPSRARRKIKHDDILMSTVRPNLKAHLHFQSHDSDWICSTGFCVLRCRDGLCSPSYVFAHLFARAINKQIDALLTGSNYPAINSKDVRGLSLLIPSVEEQTAIATVLSEMDEEIDALETKLSKARLLKQGMMQELLTGRIRLV
ncbi:MAG: restriction endonuclease subunit S [Coraliomargarita sp.]